MLDHSCQVQCHPHAERGLDLYETPAVAVSALLRVEKIPPGGIWEPAAGPGNITNVLRACGHTVIASDIHNYGGLHFVGDFLQEIGAPAGCETILTNPPFRYAQAFVEHALQLVPNVLMLLRLAFMESKRRSHILENAGLARIHCFSRRLPMMHRADWKGRKANSGMCFAWFVWSRGYVGPTMIQRIDWKENSGIAG
jgi:hypothetical protein